jgi:hypothetical protein
MKCIKNKKTGDIQRVTDKEAYNMVGNTWSYVSKSEWKLVTRKPKVEQVVEQVTEQVEKVKSKKQLRKQKAEA